MLDILDLADKAARCTLGRSRSWTRKDWQDAAQEAALAICQVQHRGGEGYAFLAARSATTNRSRSWLRHPRGGTLLDYLDYAPPDRAAPRTLDLAPLAPLLAEQGAQKAGEDLRYLELLLAGYSTDGIAREMGLSRRNVYAIRERLLPRLERIARGETPLSRGDAVRAGIARRRQAVEA